MKECDIFKAVKTYSDPSYIFSGTSPPKDLRPRWATRAVDAELSGDKNGKISEVMVCQHLTRVWRSSIANYIGFPQQRVLLLRSW